MNESPDTVILADGDFPRRQTLLDMLARAERVICCDGAADKLIEFGRMPDAIVGDLDSVSKATRRLCPDKLFKVDEQETNDLAKTLRFCCSHNLMPAALLGASGGREDHLLGNLAQFAKFSEKFPDMRFYTDHGFFVAVRDRAVFENLKNGMQISFISFDPRTAIRASGVKYPLPEKFNCWDEGTLNELTSGVVEISVSGSPGVLVFFNDI